MSLVKWLIGVDTYLYFLTVLVVLYLFCFTVRKNRAILLLFVGLSIFSNLLTAFSLIQIFHGYLNPLNFLVYFASGLLVADINIMEELLNRFRKLWPIFLTSLLIILSLLAYKNHSINYFHWYYIPIEIVAVLSVLGLSSWFAEQNSVLLQNIGKASFAIYLLHMPIAGIVANIFNRVDFFVLTLLRPMIVLVFVYSAIGLLNRILIPRWQGLKALNTMIGMR